MSFGSTAGQVVHLPTSIPPIGNGDVPVPAILQVFRRHSLGFVFK